MPVTVQVITGSTTAASTTNTLAFPATVSSNDLLIVIGSIANVGASRVSAPTALGTWTNLNSWWTSEYFGADIYTLTGITTGGNVTVTNGAYGNLVLGYVVSGLTTPDYSLAVHRSGSTAQPEATVGGVAAPILGARANTFILSYGHTASGTKTLPGPASVPSTGWTTDGNLNTGLGGMTVAHYTPTADITVQPTLKTTSTSSEWTIATYEFGFDGYEARVSASRVTAVTTNTNSERALQSTYVQVATRINPERAAQGTHISVLTNAFLPPTDDFIGWGTPIDPV